MTVSAQATSNVLQPVEVAIVGDGKRSLAAGAALATQGHSVRLASLKARPGGRADLCHSDNQIGKIMERLRLACIAPDISAAVKGVEVVVICAPVTEYGALAACLGGSLSTGQTVVLSDAPLCASLQFAQKIAAAGLDAQVNILEMGRWFDSLEVQADRFVVRGGRERVSICGRSRNETRRGLQGLSRLWTGLVPASNLLERGFTDVERLIGPVLRLFRLLSPLVPQPRIVDPPGPALVSIVSRVGDEVQALGRSFDLRLGGIEQILTDYTGTRVGSLAQAIVEIEQRAGWLGGVAVVDCEPLEKLAVDVGETLVPLAALAMLARLPVPTIDAVVELASCVTHRDLRKEGRGLHELGLVGLDVQEIIELINA
ncbi:MAG TPA: hypothetical protein V6D08_13035 [Candidatus Obscuribacterales bacterium]